MGFPLYITCCFSLAAFNILCVYSLLVWLVCILACFSLGLSCMGLLCLLDLIGYFLFHVGEIFNYNLFKIFLKSFLFLFFFWDPCNLNVDVFDIVPEVSWDYPQFFSFFLMYFALQKLFPPFYLPAHWFVLLLQISAIDSFQSIFNFNNCVVCLCMFIL